MGLRERAAMFLLHGLKGLRPDSMVYGVGQPVWTGWNFEAYAREGYGGNPYAYRAVNLIADGLAGVKVWPKRLKGSEWQDLPENHPVRKLHKQPNERQGWPKLVKAAVGTELVGGQEFILGVGPGENAPPRELWVLGPNVMSAVPGPKLGQVMAFKLRTPSGEQPFAKEDVFWSTRWDPLNGFNGISPIQPAGRSIDTNTAALGYDKALLDNGAVPGLAITLEGSPKKDERDEMRASLKARHEGAEKAGRSLFLWGGAKVTPAGFNPKDLMLPDIITATAREVAVVFGVPPELLGDASQKTFSNYREARQALFTDTILPQGDLWYGDLAMWLGNRFGEEYRFDMDLDDIEALAAIRTARRTDALAAYQAGAITLNEALAEMGYGPATLPPAKPGAEPLPDPAGFERRAPSPTLGLLGPGGKGLDCGHDHKGDVLLWSKKKLRA